MRRHDAQPRGLAGVATELMHRIEGEGPREGVTPFDTLRGRQGRQRPSPVLAGVATPP